MSMLVLAVILVVAVWNGLHRRGYIMKSMYKLVILIICCVIVFCSCNSKSRRTDMVEYESGEYFNKNWDEQVGTYQEDVIPNMETAINVATQIFEGMKKSSDSQEYVPQYVFYDEKDAIWIVSFWKEFDSDTVIVGGDCSIAIQRKDGKVMRIWFGE